MRGPLHLTPGVGSGEVGGQQQSGNAQALGPGPLPEFRDRSFVAQTDAKRRDRPVSIDRTFDRIRANGANRVDERPLRPHRDDLIANGNAIS
jgi:hypothetical protein